MFGESTTKGKKKTMMMMMMAMIQYVTQKVDPSQKFYSKSFNLSCTVNLILKALWRAELFCSYLKMVKVMWKFRIFLFKLNF